MASQHENIDFTKIAELIASIDQHKNALDRLFARADIVSPSDSTLGPCREVRGSRQGGDVPLVSINQVQLPALRSAAIIKNGYPPIAVPRQHCGNPYCLRPEHTYWALTEYSVQETKALDRDTLNASDVREIVRRARTGQSTRDELAIEFKQTKEKISRIVSGDTYSTISDDLLTIPDQSKYSSMTEIDPLDILAGLGMKTVNKIAPEKSNKVLSKLGRNYGSTTFRLKVGGKDSRALQERTYSYADIIEIFSTMRNIAEAFPQNR